MMNVVLDVILGVGLVVGVLDLGLVVEVLDLGLEVVGLHKQFFPAPTLIRFLAGTNHLIKLILLFSRKFYNLLKIFRRKINFNLGPFGTL